MAREVVRRYVRRMDVVVRLIVMLVAGLVARHAVIRVGRRLARHSTLRIPALCSYATAGTLAALVRMALAEWTAMDAILLSLVFGAFWGVVVGLGLPFARRVTA